MQVKSRPLATQSVAVNIVRPISEKKLEANRRNARKSTGPLSARGRAVSSQNARKYTIMPFENPALPAQLTAQFYGHFVPANQAERRLVDRIVRAERMRRYCISIRTRINDDKISDTEFRAMLDALSSASRRTLLVPFEIAAQCDSLSARRRLEEIRAKAA